MAMGETGEFVARCADCEEIRMTHMHVCVEFATSTEARQAGLAGTALHDTRRVCKRCSRACSERTRVEA